LLLFGLTTAFLFAMMEKFWLLGSSEGHQTPSDTETFSTAEPEAIRH
jgi:hypothetical protein